MQQWSTVILWRGELGNRLIEFCISSSFLLLEIFLDVSSSGDGQRCDRDLRAGEIRADNNNKIKQKKKKKKKKKKWFWGEGAGNEPDRNIGANAACAIAPSSSGRRSRCSSSGSSPLRLRIDPRRGSSGARRDIENYTATHCTTISTDLMAPWPTARSCR